MPVPPSEPGSRNNIIHVNFFGPNRKPPAPRLPGDAPAAVAALGPRLAAKANRRTSFVRLSAPWVIRIAAVAAILILSFLIL
jgi:hypothetical protein